MRFQKKKYLPLVHHLIINLQLDTLARQLSSFLMSIFSHCYYGFKSLVDTIMNNERTDQIVIFGRFFTLNEEARNQIARLVFLTYRQGLQINGSDVTSDMHWGCLLRVGQMLVAEVLKRYQFSAGFNNPQTIRKLFIDKNGQFSIEKMVQKGAQKFCKKIGDWYSASQVAKIIQLIIDEDNSTNLKVFVCEQMLQKHTCLKFFKQDKKNTNIQNFSSVQYNLQQINRSKLTQEECVIHPELIIIVLKKGLDFTTQEGQQKLEAVKRVMQLESFAGMLGGQSGRGFYFVGYSQTSFIYLDPHRVTNSNNFHTNDMLSIKFKEADPDMALCFYVENYEQYKDLLQNIPSYLYKKGTFAETGSAQQLGNSLLQSSKLKRSALYGAQTTDTFQLLQE